MGLKWTPSFGQEIRFVLLIQRRFLQQLRILAHYQGSERLNREDFHELLDRLPPEEQDLVDDHISQLMLRQQAEKTRVRPA
ncbi:hypothetical protein JW859_09125 [bacterium]|nr:hypothetical protein [bacterium]